MASAARGANRVTRTGHASWTVAPWSFLHEPFHKFAGAGSTLAASATTGAVTLTASAAVFQPGHAGVRFRLGGKRVLVTAVASATQATAAVEETLDGTEATTDWEPNYYEGNDFGKLEDATWRSSCAATWRPRSAASTSRSRL